MSETFTGDDAVQLAIVERSGFVESRHLGSAVVLAPDGSALRAMGDIAAPIFPRSTMKPFQAIAVMNSGVELTGPSLALATASHSGTPEHLAIVEEILAKARLDPSALQCPPDWPLDSATRVAFIRRGESTSPLFMNCSGKHAAMLLSCVRNGWPTESYLDLDHPLQGRIREVVERLTGEKVVQTGVDGCGAPVHAMSLGALARGVQRITSSADTSPFALYRNSAKLTRAVLENGWAVDGPGRANTVVIDRLGVFTKGGAEGVMVMSAPDKTTVALKILDGNLRAATVVALSLLVDAGALERDRVEAVKPEIGLAVRGGAHTVGAVRPAY